MPGTLVTANVRLAIRAITILLLVFAPGGPSRSLAAEQAARDSMPVKIANRTVIVLRGPIAGYGGSDRARATMERIHALLEAEPTLERAE